MAAYGGVKECEEKLNVLKESSMNVNKLIEQINNLSWELKNARQKKKEDREKAYITIKYTEQKNHEMVTAKGKSAIFSPFFKLFY